MYSNLEKTPRHLLVCEKSNFKNEKSRHGIHVENHYFNYRVSVLIPECGALPAGLSTIGSSFGKYYLVKNLPVYEIVEQQFLDLCVKKGSFYALSYNTRIDQDNSAALIPAGKLILSVDKDTYEELGLEGQQSQYSHKAVMRHIITIDLTDASFAPGTKKYKRVIWALKEKKPLACDFLMAWHPSGEGDFSLSSYFAKYQCKEHTPSVSTKILRDIPSPVISGGELKGKPEESCDSQEFLDWLGAASADIDCNNEASSFLSTYCCPEPSVVMGQACLWTVTGFLLPEKIYMLLEQLRHYFDEPKLAHWTTLTVHGFADSPVSWGVAEHGFHKGGENLYNFVIFRNHDYWLQMAVGTQDGCPP
ncbi:ribonuclease P protein subunit p40 [Acipenser oxyrinchus oxyrinchus]|uniref:Ribonuclease P protein subunit p40 n=1 Tax=Acipenser oxyrinchus oxyrinchus TaxID=40147 RepID=A0AAD8GFS4_ACIOX|nr:ribonuclease P protein subunit p40 [Acipenser oxyrinchus oxyrinchus]